MHLDRIFRQRSQRAVVPSFASMPAVSAVRAVSACMTVCALALAGCGNQYRPVVSAIAPVGPAGQPQKYAVVVSTSGATTPGHSDLVDFAGDTIVNETTIGVNPKYLILGSAGTEAYVINGDNTLNNYAVTSGLIQSQIDTTTLPANANPISLFPQGSFVYVAEQGLDAIGQLTGIAPPVFQQNLPTGTQQGTVAPTNTIYTVGANGAPRVYALVQKGTVPGYASAIETTTNTISANLSVGVAPVYGVMTADDRRAFVLNNGSNSVTVINAQTNALDTFTPQGGTGAATSTIAVGQSPVWADFAPTLNEVLVVNQGNGTTPGSVTVISIPLCTANAIANPNCDPNNPIDALGFGNVVATIPVGINPVQISVLQDGSQAYVANSGSINFANPAASVAGSVSVINLQTNTVVATIPTISSGALPNDSFIHGYPTYIAATTGTPTGKVYVISGAQAAPTGAIPPAGSTIASIQQQFASGDLTILRTDTNQVLLHLSLPGTGVSVRVSAQ